MLYVVCSEKNAVGSVYLKLKYNSMIFDITDKQKTLL